MDLKLILPPFTGALIGWVTNWAAIKLLFRPHLPVEVFGRSFQGLIPKRRKEIANSIAGAIEKELLTSEAVASVFSGLDIKEDVERLTEKLLEHSFVGASVRGVPIINLMAEALNAQIKEHLYKKIAERHDEIQDHIKDALSARLRDNLRIGEIVGDKIDGLDVMRFEEFFTDFIGRELRHLEYLGAVMGFIIGLLQSAYFYFVA